MEPNISPFGESQPGTQDEGAVSVPVRRGSIPGEKPVVENAAIDSDFVAPNPNHVPIGKPSAAEYAGPGSATAGSLDQPDIAPSAPTPLATKQPEALLAVDQGALLERPSEPVNDIIPVEPRSGFSKRRLLGVGLLVVGVIAASLLGLRVAANKGKNQSNLNNLSSQIKQQQLPVSTIDQRLNTASPASNAVTVNGQLQVTSSLILQPSTETGPAVTGQMYYDATTNLLTYYNGSRYVSLQGGGNTFVTNVTNVAGNTTNVTNVTNISGGGFSGTGTPGTLAMFDSASTLGNAMIAESGTTLNVGTGATTTNLQGDAGGVNISTNTADGTSGAISIVSGASATGGAGNVSIDTGAGVITGTPVGAKTFEGGLDNMADAFGYHDTLTQSTAQAHGGTHSLAVTVGLDPISQPSWRILDQQPYGAYAVTPGHKYAFSAWVRAGTNPSTITAKAHFSMDGYMDGGDVAVDTWGTVTDATGTWKQITGIVKAPGGSVSVLLEFDGTGTAVGEVHYLDDVTITDMNGSTGSSEVDLGATNAQSVTLGNNNEVGQTNILGGSGISLNSGSGATSIAAGEFDVESAEGVNIDSGTGNVNITSAADDIATGTITIESGNSSTTASGDVTVDTGSGFIAGTVVGEATFEDDAVDGFINWYNTTLAPANAVAHAGSYSLAETGTSSSANGWGIQQNNTRTSDFPAVAGHHYVFTAWWRAATTPRAIGGTINFVDSNLNVVGAFNFTSITDTTGGWTEMTASGPAPAGATGSFLSFSSGGEATGEVHYLDDVVATDLSSSSATATLNLGATNAQSVNIGNLNEINTTTIEGGSGVTIASGAGPLNESGGSVSISGSAASSFGTSAGSLTLSSGGGPGGGVIVKSVASSTAEFQVQGSTSNLLTVDSTDNAISLGVGAGSYFGYTHAGMAATSGFSAGAMYASQFKTNAAGTIGSLTVDMAEVQSGAPNDHYQMALYADNGSNAPGAYVASTAIGEPLNKGWNTLPLTAPTDVLANTEYWLVFWEDAPGGNAIAFDTGFPSLRIANTNTGTWQGGSDNGMPATWPTGGTEGTGGALSMYASFIGNGPALTINGQGGLTQSGSAVFQDPTDNTLAFQIQNSLGTDLFTADTADMQITIGGSLVATGDITVGGHIVSSGSTPTIVADAAACTGGTATIAGTDTAGTITINTGATGCSGTGTLDLATVTFAKAFANAPRVVLTPANDMASSDYFIDGATTTSFTLGYNATPQASQAYEWNYIVIQ